MICRILLGEKSVPLQFIAHEIQVLQRLIQLVLRKLAQNTENFSHKLIVTIGLPLIDAIQIGMFQKTVDSFSC